MQACVASQAPRAPAAGISHGRAPRARATAAARRSTVATAHSGSELENEYSRRKALIVGVSGAALLAAPQCAHLSPRDGPEWGNTEARENICLTKTYFWPRMRSILRLTIYVHILGCLLVLVIGTLRKNCVAYADAFAAEDSAYDFKVVQSDKERDLSEFKGQVTVILNIASE